jgi:hypothetical protein
LFSKDCHPQTIDVIKTRAEPLGLTVVIGDENSEIKEDIVCGILQYPGTLGDIKDPSEAISKIHKNNGKAVLVCDLLALAKLKTPAELGADIALEAHKDLEFQWVMVVLMRVSLQLKMNLKDQCLEELLVSLLIDMAIKLTDFHFKQESNI